MVTAGGNRLFGTNARAIRSPVPTIQIGYRAIAVGWGTALQAARSRVRFPMESLGLFIDLNDSTMDFTSGGDRVSRLLKSNLVWLLSGRRTPRVTLD